MTLLNMISHYFAGTKILQKVEIIILKYSIVLYFSIYIKLYFILSALFYEYNHIPDPKFFLK